MYWTKGRHTIKLSQTLSFLSNWCLLEMKTHDDGSAMWNASNDCLYRGNSTTRALQEGEKRRREKLYRHLARMSTIPYTNS